MRKTLAVLATACMLVACGGSEGTSPTSTSPMPVVAPATVVAAAPSEAPASDPTPDPNQNGGNYDENVTADAAGNVTIKNLGTASYDGQICYYWNGPHPQTLAQEPTVVHIAPGRTKTFAVPQFTFAVEETDCEVTKEIQGDVGFIECTNDNSGQLAPAGVKPGPLHKSFYFDVTQEGEGEWESGATATSWGDWGSCDNLPQASTLPEELCFECREGAETTTQTHTCTQETRTRIADLFDKREIECPCEEGGPYNTEPGETVWENDPKPGMCPDSTPDPNDARCWQHDFGTYPYTETFDCKDPVTTHLKMCGEKPVDCPCEVEWIAEEPVKENIGEWGECHADQLAGTREPEWTECEGVMSRTFEWVVYEVNSCTQERRVRSRRGDSEESPCGYKCLAGITHTENKKYCGWLGCQNKWYIGSSVKWQCQSVPPGTPGHYDNHFGKNGHDDYFGVPVAEKCWNVAN